MSFLGSSLFAVVISVVGQNDAALRIDSLIELFIFLVKLCPRGSSGGHCAGAYVVFYHLLSLLITTIKPINVLNQIIGCAAVQFTAL